MPVQLSHRVLAAAFEQELAAGRTAVAEGALKVAYRHVERAHVLGQARTGCHLRSHWAFLAWAHAAGDRRELVGQFVRLVAAALATWIWVPRGNTGGATASALTPMPVPEDLAELVEAGT
jgi:hypothetical protein